MTDRKSPVLTLSGIDDTGLQIMGRSLLDSSELLFAAGISPIPPPVFRVIGQMVIETVIAGLQNPDTEFNRRYARQRARKARRVRQGR